MTVGSPPSNAQTTEFVVPRSIPTARVIPGPLPHSRLTASPAGSLMPGFSEARLAATGVLRVSSASWSVAYAPTTGANCFRAADRVRRADRLQQMRCDLQVWTKPPMRLV
ncbi:hypothetical protein Pth03_27530 [Planotetraspora thailandica]|uniref:Uncharacterized protein n=1 Tax=Planotetraspora thailandica TaxID=487172 RepID=A0A8J3XVI9_9ACTN|nr:hypothetical protein Pth03_27530 [Planotetraspora thailandica]